MARVYLESVAGDGSPMRRAVLLAVQNLSIATQEVRVVPLFRLALHHIP